MDLWGSEIRGFFDLKSLPYGRVLHPSHVITGLNTIRRTASEDAAEDAVFEVNHVRYRLHINNPRV